MTASLIPGTFTLYCVEDAREPKQLCELLLLEMADRMRANHTRDPWPAFHELRREVIARESGPEAVQLVLIALLLEALDARN